MNATTVVRSAEDDMNALLQEAGVSSIEELASQLQVDEDIIFVHYKEVQEQTEELERVETEIKHLELNLEAQNAKIEALESQNINMKKDIDAHIESVHRQIGKYTNECSGNLGLLAAVSDSLMVLLKNVRYYFACELLL
jgi:predicted RNase H-like nuclease (RuvC/YqgF family)